MLLNEILALNEDGWSRKKIKQKTAQLGNGDKVLICVEVELKYGYPEDCNIHLLAKSGKFVGDDDFDRCYEPMVKLEFANDQALMNTVLNVIAADTKKLETEQSAKEFAEQWRDVVMHELMKHDMVLKQK